jgi:hypothetical protein
MNAQPSLPGIRAEVPTGNRAALEEDLRGETALCLMALFSWSEFHGGLAPWIDRTVEKFLTVGQPADPQITRAITNTRRALARYLATGAAVPRWLPASVLALLKEPPTDVRSPAIAPAPPSEIAPATTSPRRHTATKSPETETTHEGKTP